MRYKKQSRKRTREIKRRFVFEYLENRLLLSNSPTINTVTPAAGATAIALNATVQATVNLPNGGIDPNTVNSSTVYLYQTGYPNNNARFVPASVKTTGGGDALLLSPLQNLLPNTSYTFVVTSGVADVNMDAFTPFTEAFTTGNSVPAVSQTYAFTQVALPATTGFAMTDVQMGPDGDLWASTEVGQILRFPINSDGTLGTPQVISTLQTAYGGNRLISGFAFDPSFIANPASPKIWVSNTYYALSGATNAPNFTSSLTVMSGTNLQTVTDAIVDLPRSVADHVNDQPVFQPGTDNLFFCQAGENAYGAPDTTWGNRPETELSGAILEVNTDLLNLSGPALNVLTPDATNDSGVLLGGTYNPNAGGAPLTIYATGIRNAFDLLFDDKGQLWAPANGSSSGGNAPAGGGAPALNDIQQVENDSMFKVVKGAYYGHPNPIRGQYVLDQGNPTTGAIPGLAFTAYPSGTNPDPNYQLPNYVFGLHSSPDGIIEYQGSAFGGALSGKFLVAEYSAPDDIVVLSRDSSDNIIGGLVSGTSTPGPDRSVSGFQHLNGPVSLVENPATGYIYVSQLGANNLMLLEPSSVKPQITASLPRLVFNTIATGNAGAGPSRTENFTITNTGADVLSFTSISVINAPSVPAAASDFTVVNAANEPASLNTVGNSFTFQLQFNASIVGLETAILQIKSNDPVTPTLSVYLHGIGTAGLYGANEPSLAQVLQANGIPTIVGAGPNDVNINTVAYPESPDPSSQEVSMQVMMAASAGPVTITPLASFSANSQPVSNIGYYTPGGATSTTQLFSIAQADAQTVTPTAVGATSFTPGAAPFGLFADFPGISTPSGAPDYHYSEDALNVPLDPVNPRKIRFFPYETATGVVVPNTYVFAVEDYNSTAFNSFDNFVGIISNVTGGVVAPKNLAAATNTGGVVLTWTASTGATSYTVAREDPGASTFTPIATGLTSPTYTDGAAVAGQSYQYEVQAVNALNGSAFTPSVSATPPVAAPTNLQVVSATASGIVLTWTASVGATSYTVAREDPGSSTFTPIATGLASPTYTDVTTTAGQTYHYQVQAVGATSSSPFTAAISVNRAIPAPPAPTNLQISSESPSAVVLTWTAAAGATTYSVQRQGPADSTFVQIGAGLTTTTYTDTDVKAGQTYQYEVLAANSSGMSPASASASASLGASLSVTVGKGANKSVQFMDDAGTLTTIAFTGQGTAAVNFIASTISQTPDKTGALVSGTGIAIDGITTAGSAANSALTITTRGGANTIDVGGITVDGSLKLISAKTANLIGALTVGGGISMLTLGSAGAADISVGGAVQTFQIAAASDVSLTAAGPIKNLKAGTWNSSRMISAPSIASITIAGDATLNIDTAILHTLRVHGTLGASQLTLTGAGTTDLATLSAGAITGTMIIAAGNLGAISAGSLSSSKIYAGAASSATLPATVSDFSASSSILSVTLKKNPAGSLVDSSIAATAIKKASLGDVQFSNGGAPFGVAAMSVNSLTFIDPSTGKSVALNKLSSESLVTADLAAKGVSPQDFVIRIV
ncbi:MAG TPA: fibronectin type III domain-containing protein [Tepidisphaeraceae bacterium]|nr:fibronectin type III domain-containing protein [Tepidisphaeraceae bacterium]